MKRKFQALFLSLALVLGVGGFAVSTTGCAPSAASVATDGAAVATALDSIAALEQPTNPALAEQLLTAAATLKTATANWQSGSPTADINTAATAVEAVLAAIPVTAPYAPLVAIAVAALDVILANTVPSGASAGPVAANPYHASQNRYRLSRSPLHPTWNSAFKHAWNGNAKKLGYGAFAIH